MPYYADVVHRTKNRVRIKLRSKPMGEAFYVDIAQVVADIPGVEKVHANPVTGSLLFEGQDIPLDHVVQALAQKTAIRFEEAPAFHPVQRAVMPFVSLSKKLKSMTGGEVGLTEAGFLACLGIGVIQILRGNITAPPWYTAFWYAFGVFSKALVEKYSSTPAPVATVSEAPPEINGGPDYQEHTEPSRSWSELQVD